MDRISTKGQMIDQIDLRGVPHSGFDRSNHNFGTGKLGTLIATRLDEVYPGDRIKGTPETVANFEPLVQPLMGSMVLKQESWFVPYIQIWRHAWKFFTGKNGFNENMPSVSPLHIFQVYDQYVHNPIFNNFSADPEELIGFSPIIYNFSRLYELNDPDLRYDDVSISTDTLIVDLKNSLESVYGVFLNVYGSKKMLDLVMPAYNIFKRFVYSSYIEDLSSKLQDIELPISERRDLILGFSKQFGSVLRDYFNFFHGPSSLFDYLGWPVPVDLAYYNGITKVNDNLFEYVIHRNILIWNSDSFNAHLNPLFSQVSLVFNPFKAYFLIWYWNYRDQLLETGILDPEDDEFLGSTITDNVILYCTINRQRCWFKDSFTTALTNTGDGNLLVPTLDQLSQEGSIEYYDEDGNLINTKDADEARNAGATAFAFTNGSYSYRIPMNYLHGAQQGDYDGTSSASANYISLDMLDRIKRLRSHLQKRLILGYEVDDVIYSSFMVSMSNVRMHIPELLGRGRDAVQMNVLVNNTSTAEQVAGDRTAMAYAHGKQSEMNYFSEDWGLFLTITTIMPIQTYAGSMQRLYLKRDVFDYMWPEFSTMGMDAVYNCELAALGTRLSDEDGLKVFGYQGRYYDLKSRLDEEHGRLLTDLNFLTFSREWSKDNPPKLNYMFVHCWPRLDGFVLASPDVDVFRFDCYNAHAWERRLPVPSEYVS